MSERAARPVGIPGSALSGPFPVGAYAARLRERLREFARVQVFGEVWGFRARPTKVYFELRDASGALPCSMWRKEFDALGLGALEDGMRVVAAGGCDYYPGSHSSSPSFSFAVDDLRPAGEGDLLAQLAQLRRRLAAEGLFEPQKALPRPALPRVIGVVTGEGGKARDDVLAGLRRRGWSGRVVWAFAPVQDRHAAPAITRALTDLAACEAVDVVIVARGGGSLADLFAFCDESLCRTVALLRVPVIASVGHHTDRTLIDDVAAVSCSTPTHAAEAAVRIHCGEARAALAATAGRLQRHAARMDARRAGVAAYAARLERLAARAVLERARHLAVLSRAPAAHVARQQARLHQSLRELRAAGRRRSAAGAAETLTRGVVLRRKGAATATAVERERERTARLARAVGERAGVERRATDLARLATLLDAHDPQRTLERGYAIVEGPDGEPITTTAAATAAERLTLRLSDGRLPISAGAGGAQDGRPPGEVVE